MVLPPLLFLKNNFIYLYLTVRGSSFLRGLFSGCRGQGYSPFAVPRFLTVVEASLGAEHGF